MNSIRATVCFFACVLVASPRAYAQDGEPDQVDKSSQVQVVHVAGQWSSSTVPSLALPIAELAWTLDAIRLTGGEIRGQVSLSGAPVSSAIVAAKLSGKGVVGQLLDGNGQVIATFEGSVSEHGASGTFKYVGGSGTWKSDAVLP